VPDVTPEVYAALVYNRRVRPVLLLVLCASTAACVPDGECGEGEVCVVAGTGELGFNGDGLPALETDLYLPTAVRPGVDGAMLIVDFNNLRVRALTADGTVETRVGSGIHAYSQPGTAAPESPLENPIDVGIGPDGLLYVAPLHEGRLLRVDADGRVEVVAGTGELGDSGDGGPALDAQLWYPAGIAFAGDDVYVCDQVLGTVRRIDAEGVIETVMTDLSLPRGIWADDDRLLVADSRNHRVQQLDLATGDVSTLIEPGTLQWPDAIAVTPGGTVLVSEQRGARISAWDGALRAVVGTGEAEAPPSRSRPPLEMPLMGPGGLHVVDGDLWIADTEGSRVLVWDGAVEAID